MAFAPFKTEVFKGGRPGQQAPVPATDETPLNPEQGALLPWFVKPDATWIDYNCWVEVHLDPGMALHKPLPQRAMPIDTLASAGINDVDLGANVKGVNIGSSSGAADIIQRMATSTYLFKVRGYAKRVGYQIPIPGLKTVAGVVATPEKQMAYNRLAGNLAGIPVFEAAWDLWYMIAGPLPTAGTAPIPFNPSLRIRADAQLPKLIRFPFVPPDQRAGVQGQQAVAAGGGAGLAGGH